MPAAPHPPPTMSKAFPFLLALAAALVTLPAAAAGDVAAGQTKAAMCIGCHGIPGYQASFPEIHKVPMISGQNAGYIVAALAAYKKGERKHPTMRGLAASMTDEDMADLGAFYAQHGQSSVKPVAATTVREPSAAVAALLTRGACASCHGADYNQPIDGNYPKIAGQHADYLYVALRSYKTQGNRHVGRVNPIMVTQAAQFSNAELKAMADYLATLPGDLRVQPQPRFRR
jgi:cytochrome c553